MYPHHKGETSNNQYKAPINLVLPFLITFHSNSCCIQAGESHLSYFFPRTIILKHFYTSGFSKIERETFRLFDFSAEDV